MHFILPNIPRSWLCVAFSCVRQHTQFFLNFKWIVTGQCHGVTWILFGVLVCVGTDVAKYGPWHLHVATNVLPVLSPCHVLVAARAWLGRMPSGPGPLAALSLDCLWRTLEMLIQPLKVNPFNHSLSVTQCHSSYGVLGTECQCEKVNLAWGSSDEEKFITKIGLRKLRWRNVY